MDFKFTYIPEDEELISLNDDEISLSDNDNDDSDIIKNSGTHQSADYSSYQLPGADLLIPQDEDDYDHAEEIKIRSTEILDTLASFGVKASLADVDRGPRITRYHIVPEKGVKVTSILNLENDIALSLGVSSVRMEAPIPGKHAIGIDIPNDQGRLVRISELIDTDEFRSKKQKTTVCLGKDITGAPVFSDIESLPHLLIAGATGMGKSICVDALISSMLYKARPDELKFILIDPKRVEFSRYNGLPHLLVPVITDIKQAAGALSWALEEMNRRYDLFTKAQVSNITEYNNIVNAPNALGETLPRIAIIIDELADLMMEARRPVEDLLMKLAQRSRFAGIHLIISTQRPDVSVISGTVKANIPARISFRVASYIDSKTILDAPGAQMLLSMGDMLYKSGSLKLTRIQGAYISDEEIKRIISFIKSQTQGESYNEDVMTYILCAAKKINNKCSDDYDSDDSHNSQSKSHSFLDDPEFLNAVDIALSQGQISTAILQRKLSIGFGKAARFIDYMEGMGIVSPKNGAKPRNVLITRDEWIERFSRAAIEDDDEDEGESDIECNDIFDLLKEIDGEDTEDSTYDNSNTLKESAKRMLHIMDESDQNSNRTHLSYETVASMIKIVAIGASIDINKFMEAINYAVRDGHCSTAMLQRKIGIGFAKAATFIDLMEEMGIVGKKNGASPREVFMTEGIWRDVLKKLEND